MDAHADPSHHVVQRYFQMWNTGDTSIAPEVLSPDWADHAHPEVSGPADVQRAVTQIHAGFYQDSASTSRRSSAPTICCPWSAASATRAAPASSTAISSG